MNEWLWLMWKWNNPWRDSVRFIYVYWRNSVEVFGIWRFSNEIEWKWSWKCETFGDWKMFCVQIFYGQLQANTLDFLKWILNLTNLPSRNKKIKHFKKGNKIPAKEEVTSSKLLSFSCKKKTFIPYQLNPTHTHTVSRWINRNEKLCEIKWKAQNHDHSTIFLIQKNKRAAKKGWHRFLKLCLETMINDDESALNLTCFFFYIEWWD